MLEERAHTGKAAQSYHSPRNKDMDDEGEYIQGQLEQHHGEGVLVALLSCINDKLNTVSSY